MTCELIPHINMHPDTMLLAYISHGLQIVNSPEHCGPHCSIHHQRNASQLLLLHDGRFQLLHNHLAVGVSSDLSDAVSAKAKPVSCFLYRVVALKCT